MEPIRITATSGSITVTAEARDGVAVDRGQEHPMGGVLEVKGESRGVTMRVPYDSDLVVGSHSGSVELLGRLGSVRVTTRNGRVDVEDCASIDARTVSGRVDIGTVRGEGRIKTASGHVKLKRVDGPLHVATVSGRIDVTGASAPVRANTVNGQVEIGMSKAADARADSVSGAVTIDLPGGVHPKTSFMSVSGRCVCEPEQGDDCHVTGRTVSGRITVRARR